MVTVDSFVAEFAEFEKLPRSMVEAKIAEAQRSFAEDILGVRYDDAVKYQTAVLLTSSPGGRPAALTKDKATPYDKLLQSILDASPGRGLLLCL